MQLRKDVGLLLANTVYSLLIEPLSELFEQQNAELSATLRPQHLGVVSEDR